MWDTHCVYAKIYGERNSGTNFIEQLLRTNFAVLCLTNGIRISDYVDVVGVHLPSKAKGELRSAITDIECERTLCSDFGWKHGVPPRDEILAAPHTRHTLFICVAKHPLAWLRSLANRPYNPIGKVPKTFSQFLEYEWPLTRRDNLPGRTRIDVIDLWNVKNAAFQNLTNLVEQCIVVAYEDILRDPSGFLADVRRYLLPKREEFVWSLASTKGDGTTFEGYREKNDIRTLCRATPLKQIEFIEARIDQRVMSSFGYGWPAPERILGE